MGVALRKRLSHLVGWLTDLRVPKPLRRFVYGTYCRFTGADASEAQLTLEAYGSLGAFFVRRLKDGARRIDSDPSVLVSPCDGTVQNVSRIEAGTILQAKGQAYSVRELLDLPEEVGDLEGGLAITIYLSPRDYHRVHVPEAATLTRVRWLAGDRRSVAPRVLASTERVLATNERAVIVLEGERVSYHLVMVGALNVGRIRVVGVDPGASPPRPRPMERGDELARFEMGSTVVLVFPPGVLEPRPELVPERPVRLGEPLARFLA